MEQIANPIPVFLKKLPGCAVDIHTSSPLPKLCLGYYPRNDVPGKERDAVDYFNFDNMDSLIVTLN